MFQGDNLEAMLNNKLAESEPEDKKEDKESDDSKDNLFGFSFVEIIREAKKKSHKVVIRKKELKKITDCERVRREKQAFLAFVEKSFIMKNLSKEGRDLVRQETRQTHKDFNDVFLKGMTFSEALKQGRIMKKKEERIRLREQKKARDKAKKSLNKTEQDSRDKSKKKAKEETKKEVEKDSREAERESEKEKAPSKENLGENSLGKWTEVQRSRRSREKDSREAEKAEDKARKSTNEAGIPGLHYLSAERDRQSANVYTFIECNPGKIE